MINVLIEFFKGRYNEKLPVLLAFSGGPDSLALLNLLMEFRKSNPLKLAIAHVDHGWRDESAVEALEIAAMAEKLGVAFHLNKLDPKQMKGNIEAACREERFRFFAFLSEKYHYQAVLLAHHSDDVAETVLKRVLEGVNLPYLSAIRAETIIHGIKIWRPLLSVSKKNILEWLAERKLQGFVDKTNQDTKFLRARFRLEVLPYLSEKFGKEVSSGLCQIAEEASELRDYLDEKLRPNLDKIVKGRWGSFLDLSKDYPNTSFELKCLIRQFCKQGSFAISRECLEQAVEFVRQKTANKCFVMGKGSFSKAFYLDRGRLFISLKELPSLFPLFLKIEETTPLRFDNWEVQKASTDFLKMNQPTDWKSLWEFGKAEVILPKGDYEIAPPPSSLNKWWAEHKIPAFFRQKIPVIMENGIVKHEFMTGKIFFSPSNLLASEKNEYIKIKLLYSCKES